QLRRGNRVVGCPIGLGLAVDHIRGGVFLIVSAGVRGGDVRPLGQVLGEGRIQQFAPRAERLYVVLVNPSAAIRRDIQNQVRSATDRLVVDLQQVCGRTDVLIFVGVIEPARPDRNVDFAGQPIGAVPLAL